MGQAVVRYFSVLSVSPCPDIPVQTDGVQLPPVIYVLIPSLSHSPTASNTHSGAEQPSSIRPPKNSPGGGLAANPSKCPEESCAPVCPPLTQADGQERSRDPITWRTPAGSHWILVQEHWLFLRLLVTCPPCSWRRQPDWVWANSSRAGVNPAPWSLVWRCFSQGSLGPWQLCSSFCHLELITGCWRQRAATQTLLDLSAWVTWPLRWVSRNQGRTERA